jgi:uncharacterized protein (TIGR04255 family)
LALEFGQHADVVFDRAPLKTVLCQVRFPRVLALLAEAGITGFQAAVREEYPRLLEVERSASVEMTPETAKFQASAPVWRFTDDGSWTVGLAVDFISLETPEYKDIDDFLQRFNRVLTALHRTVWPADSVRVGLRKVSAIACDEGERDTACFLGIIRPEMLGPLAVKSFPATISGNYSQLQFEEQFHHLVVRYGLQTLHERMNFVLDLDYFTEQPYKVDGGEQLAGLLRYFSDGMTSFFHWAVEDEYKATLGPRPREKE